MSIKVVRPESRKPVSKQMKDIPVGTVFQFGGRISTFIRTDEGCFSVETGVHGTFPTDVFENYIEYPDAQLVLKP